MTEPIKNHDMAAHGSYEHQDLNPKGIIYFFVALAVFLGLIYLISFGIYHALNSVDEANKTTLSPMVAPKVDPRAVSDADTQAFPEPRLQKDEPTDLRQFVEDQDRRLATYNWVDKDKGVVQIPIDRAMDLIVQRGLPVRPQGQPAAQKGQQQQKEGSSAQ